ncbi:YqaI family protein [Peribacillus asahii]|uniref:YqaI family protein n=1 Tax=Peribacillus asahii TaxID=228899 RepID=UPI00207A8B26|nr:hypothetical protein [Peribacillus asahii]USK71734.1 hypothetical protein LIS76_08265 [Peribacillus asahii]
MEAIENPMFIDSLWKHDEQQEEAIGVDYFGNEIWPGDDYFEDPEHGEMVLQEYWQDYMNEVYGFKFRTAE